MKLPFFVVVATILLIPSLGCADWNQWRGPDRNGIAPGVDLPAAWPETFEPKLIWESETIPSDQYGGHGSPVISDGRVFLGLVWHRDAPAVEREVTGQVLSRLGHRQTDLDAETMQKLEEARLNLNPRLRGQRLSEWAEAWTKEHLDEDAQLRYSGWVERRLAAGKTALPWADLERIAAIRDRVFPNEDELNDWVASQAWEDPSSGGRFLEAVPNTRREAEDTVLALDFESGETLWRWSLPGEAVGRNASSTVAAVDGKVYALLSEHAVCLDQASGEERWTTDLGEKVATAWSPLVEEGRLYVSTRRAVKALDAETGEVLWENANVRTTHGSPVVWKDLLIFNGARELVALELDDGELRWSMPSGGDSTPVIAGDMCVLASRDKQRSLAGFRLSIEGAREVWSHSFKARRYGSSPVVVGDAVYYFGSSRHLCVDLETGEERWEVERVSELSSPVLAGDKLLIFENRGGFLAAVAGRSDEYRPVGRFKTGALGCTTPALSDHRMIVRKRDRVVAYDLRVPEG